MSGFLKAIARPIARLPFMRSMAVDTGVRMQAFGLQYEDLLIETPEVKHALARLTPEEYQARIGRLKRAMDLSLKHEHMHAGQALDPYTPYLRQHRLDVAEEAAEQAAEITPSFGGV